MFSEKVQKETVTDDLIKKDILHLLRSDGHEVVNVILSVVCIAVAAFFTIFTPYAWFLLLIPASVFAIIYINRYRLKRDIKNGNFTVITDKLVDEKQNEPRTEMTFYKGRYVSYLEFGCNDRWELEGSYYTWSKLYRMSDSGICNTSLVGDEFYLVLYNKNNKILMAYNSRFFDYQKQ